MAEINPLQLISGGLRTAQTLRSIDDQTAALRRDADIVAREANAAEELQRRRGRSAMGDLRAAAAEAGLTAGGTFEGVYDQAAVDAELDALNIRYSGLSRRAALRQQAVGLQSQRRMALVGGVFDTLANSLKPSGGTGVLSSPPTGYG